MSGSVKNLYKTPHFPLEAEVYDRIKRTLAEYEGRLSFVAAIGILELVKNEYLKGSET